MMCPSYNKSTVFEMQNTISGILKTKKIINTQKIQVAALALDATLKVANIS